MKYFNLKLLHFDFKPCLHSCLSCATWLAGQALSFRQPSLSKPHWRRCSSSCCSSPASQQHPGSGMEQGVRKQGAPSCTCGHLACSRVDGIQVLSSWDVPICAEVEDVTTDLYKNFVQYKSWTRKMGSRLSRSSTKSVLLQSHKHSADTQLASFYSGSYSGLPYFEVSGCYLQTYDVLQPEPRQDKVSWRDTTPTCTAA